MWRDGEDRRQPGSNQGVRERMNGWLAAAVAARASDFQFGWFQDRGAMVARSHGNSDSFATSED